MAASYVKENLRGSKKKRYIRIFLFFLPFFLPIYIYNIPKINQWNVDLAWYVMAIMVSIVALIVQIKEFKGYLNKDIYFFLPYMPISVFITAEISLIGGVFFEELFFRVFLPEISIFLDTILSGLFFSLFHMIQKNTRENLSYKSYIILFILGGVWYLSYRYSGSILPAIIGHFIYNLPNMLVVLNRYYVSQKYKNEFDLNINID